MVGGAQSLCGPGRTPQHGQPRREHPAALSSGQSPGRAGRPQVELRSSAGLRNPSRFLGGVTLHLKMSPRVLVRRDATAPLASPSPPPSPSPGPRYPLPGVSITLSISLVFHPEQVAVSWPGGRDVGAATESGCGGTGKIQIIVPEVLQ